MSRNISRASDQYVVTKALGTVEIGDDEAGGPGTFSLILSNDTHDRDGEVVESGAFNPLPEHISMDVDHGMSVVTTVGSGRPWYNPSGELQVDGTFASTDLGQSVRTLVREGHVRTASVSMIPTVKTKSSSGDGPTRITKAELLNGAFTPVPSNTTARVLSAKSARELADLADLKVGARNSQSDQSDLQSIHDLAAGLGAICGDGSSEGKHAEGKYAETKSKYSAEQLRQMLADGDAYRNPDGEPSYPIADRADLVNAIHAVGRGGADHDKIRAYIIGRAKALGADDAIPDNWNPDGSISASKAVVAPDADADREGKSSADAAARKRAPADAADDTDTSDGVFVAATASALLKTAATQ